MLRPGSIACHGDRLFRCEPAPMPGSFAKNYCQVALAVAVAGPEIPAWPALVRKNHLSNTGRDSPPENRCIRRRLRTPASATENTGAHQQSCQAAAVFVLASARPVQAVGPTLACKQGTPNTAAEAFSSRTSHPYAPLDILRYRCLLLASSARVQSSPAPKLPLHGRESRARTAGKM